MVKEDGEDILYMNGRRIVRKSEISRIVSNEYDRTKGSGAGKLTYSLKQRFVGLSQKRILLEIMLIYDNVSITRVVV